MLDEKCRRPLQLFPANDALEFAALGILCPLLTMSNVNQFVLVMKDRYLKLKRSVLTSMKITAHFSLMVIDH